MKVHLLIGTRKGGFIATSDAARREWSLKGPLLKGCEVNHIAHVGNGRLVMAGKSAWWGPALQISDAPGRPGASPARSASGKAAVGVRADFLPDKEPEVGQCVHHMEMHTQQPDSLYQQNHCGLYRSDDGGDSGPISRRACRPVSDFRVPCCRATAIRSSSFRKKAIRRARRRTRRSASSPAAIAARRGSG